MLKNYRNSTKAERRIGKVARKEKEIGFQVFARLRYEGYKKLSEGK